MAAITEILETVKQILAYFEVADGANVVEIIKNALESIFTNLPMPL